MPNVERLAVGVIGLGSMGLGTARALIDGGHEVHGYDVDPAANAALAAAGGSVASSPAALATRCQVLIVLVVNTAQVDAVLFGEQGAASTAAPGTLVMQCATVAPHDARRLAAALEAYGLPMLDAPVSGGAAKARAGALSVMASGSEAAFALAAPVLDVMADTVHRLGDACGAGSSVKLVNQLLAGVHIAAAAEAIALGLRLGLDARSVFEVIRVSAGNSWMFENRVPHMLDGDYAPRSAVDIFVKDLGLVADAGRALRFPLPVSAAALQQFLAASAAGHGGEDDAAVIKVFARLAGLQLPGQATADPHGGEDA
jgi:L-threonate 2-dehydrogenase